MKKGLTELVFVLDRSGSMTGLEDDTVGGYNALLEGNRAIEGEAVVTTVLFDHEMIRLHDRVPIAEVHPMTRSDYVPRGSTALLDAVGFTLRDMERTQKILPEECRAEHVMVAIATDGYENASTHFDYAQVKRMMIAAQERGWEVVFLGANIDVAAEAARIGVRTDHAMRYEATPAGTAQAYDVLLKASTCVRAGEPVSSRSKHKEHR